MMNLNYQHEYGKEQIIFHQNSFLLNMLSTIEILSNREHKSISFIRTVPGKYM